MNSLKVWLGEPYPLGATWCGNGVNFALYSENATGVELCLFDHPDDAVESARIHMTEQTDQVWHLFLPEIRPGQLYGYRVHGLYDPRSGHRFNAAKLLIDPYAKAIAGQVKWGDALLGFDRNSRDTDLTRNYDNSAKGVPKCVVVDSEFDWEGDTPPRLPLHESVIYETHVRGFSQLHPGIPERLRGSYAALGSHAAIDYFNELGITAVELLPVHQHVDDRFLCDMGLSNYWGYSTIGYFAPEAGYASSNTRGGQVSEFKRMVRSLHRAGIEVILDVVYNHTAEGNQLGPTLCFRGIDNQAYYRLAENPRYYKDYTGCGNTLNVQNPRVLQLIMDSLRYWVTEMHVDGFRFDLASTLAREEHDVSKLSGFFDIIHQDPILSRVKLIAEPWDVGEGGYQVGNFPVLWAEWNGKYRDSLRRYWKGDEGHAREIAHRLAGSPDLYRSNGKRPYASINFITSHDGFTLADLVSYNEKHNQANGEGNRDGDNTNHSWNCGAEGPSDAPAITALRARQRRNFLASLFLSQGVPMLAAGDEFGRTQQGNNNAYCQDNALNWLHWEQWPGTPETPGDPSAQALQAYTARLIRLRREHPIFRRPKFFQNRRIHGSEVKDIMWFTPEGREMTEEEWRYDYVRCLAMMLAGDAMDVRDPCGEPIRDATFLLLLNAHHEPVRFTLPACPDCPGSAWRLVLDTRLESGFLEGDDAVSTVADGKGDPAAAAPRLLKNGEPLELLDRSLCLLQRQTS